MTLKRIASVAVAGVVIASDVMMARGAFHVRAKILFAVSSPAVNVRVTIHEMGFPDDPRQNNHDFGAPDAAGIVEGDVRDVRQVAVRNTQRIGGVDIPDPLGGTHLEDDKLDHPIFRIVVVDGPGHVYSSPTFPFDVISEVIVPLPPEFGPVQVLPTPGPVSIPGLSKAPGGLTPMSGVALVVGNAGARRPSKPKLSEITDQTKQKKLVDLMNRYLTDDVVAHHGMLHRMVTTDVFTMHRPLIQDLERFLARNGGEAFVPFPRWDPGDPIPEWFSGVRQPDAKYLRRRDGLLKLNTIPRFPVIQEWKYPDVCKYESLNDLALDVAPIFNPKPEEATPGMPFVFGGWHKKVHDGVGGTLQDLSIAAAAHIFWAFHARMDDIWADWESCSPR